MYGVSTLQMMPTMLLRNAYQQEMTECCSRETH